MYHWEEQHVCICARRHLTDQVVGLVLRLVGLVHSTYPGGGGGEVVQEVYQGTCELLLGGLSADYSIRYANMRTRIHDQVSGFSGYYSRARSYNAVYAVYRHSPSQPVGYGSMHCARLPTIKYHQRRIKRRC